MRDDHQELLERLEIPADCPVVWIPLGLRDPEAEGGYSYEAVPVVPVQCCTHMESACAMCVEAWSNDYMIMRVWIQNTENQARLDEVFGMLNIPGRIFPLELPNN